VDIDYQYDTIVFLECETC